MTCRLLVITPECPLPANHGGRVDVVRRLMLLRARGIATMLVFWAAPSEREAVEQLMPELETLADEFVILETISVRAHLWRGARYPLWVGQRALTVRQAAEIAQKVRSFGATAVLLDHLNAAAGFEALQTRHYLPAVYRSHNIESRYAALQTADPQGLRQRLIAALVRRGMKSLEQRIRRNVKAVFDISLSDLDHWRSTGEVNGHWLPPAFDPETARRLSNLHGWRPGYNVGYLGNLYANNNVEGVLWFLAQVVPLLRQRRPDMSICIAGANPVPAIRTACSEAQVTLCADPAESVAVLRDCEVLVNPVFRSSGMNVKAVEMLFTPARLVSTPEGLTGLPATATTCFEQARTPEDFASAILDARPAKDRSYARSLFGDAALVPLIDALCQGTT